MTGGQIALLEHAEALADAAGMEKPEGLRWGLKAVRADLRSYGDYRWPLPGKWAGSDNVDTDNAGPCPRREGDGLCVAKKWRGMRYARASSRTLLLVGYRREDVLGEDEEKVRVRAAYVRDIVDGERLVREYGRASNLSRADLSRADLSGANLSGANLWGANLWGANLWGADLREANLWGADLREANLWGAVLRGANLWEANLSRADLSGANLWGADLREANLRKIHADHYTRWPQGFDLRRLK